MSMKSEKLLQLLHNTIDMCRFSRLCCDEIASESMSNEMLRYSSKITRYGFIRDDKVQLPVYYCL